VTHPDLPERKKIFPGSLDLTHASRLNYESSLLWHSLPSPWRPWSPNADSIHRNKHVLSWFSHNCWKPAR